MIDWFRDWWNSILFRWELRKIKPLIKDISHDLFSEMSKLDFDEDDDEG